MAANAANAEPVQPPGPLDADRVLLDDPPRAPRQEDRRGHPVARFAHVVGHEDHRESGLAPHPLELLVEHVPHVMASSTPNGSSMSSTSASCANDHAGTTSAGELVRHLGGGGRGSPGRGAASPPGVRSRAPCGSSAAARHSPHGEPREPPRTPGTSAWLRAAPVSIVGGRWVEKPRSAGALPTAGGQAHELTPGFECDVVDAWSALPCVPNTFDTWSRATAGRVESRPRGGWPRTPRRWGGTCVRVV